MDVFVESGDKRTFAGAVTWPGWARAAKTEEDALDALAAYRDRYAAVARLAGETVPERPRLTVVARLSGGSGTDYGVLGAALDGDAAPLSGKQLVRDLALLRAAWAAFDRAAEAAAGVRLRTGPRGGGRDLAKMRGHVLEAEEAYLAKLGRKPPARRGDVDAQLAAVRRAALEAVEARAMGEDVPDPNQVRARWELRYYVRRSAWHALDHAWELEDRSA